jgi:ring-1,2-phenylacetyl-CoA epoxidase subunit PaaD
MQAIEDDIQKILQTNGIETAKINTIYSPPWTTDWMTELAKKKLRSYGIAPPGMTTLVQVDIGNTGVIICPLCSSHKVKCISQFSSTACKALYQCLDCKEPFDYFKPH